VWTHHERVIGENLIREADARALAIAIKKAAAETAALQAQVNSAQQEAQNAQDSLNQYIAAHPIGSVVCNVTPSRPVPKTPGIAGGTQGGGAGPGVVPPVSAGPTATGNIGPGLAILVQAAARLAVLEHEWQQAVIPSN
jgi:hypothetical protein